MQDSDINALIATSAQESQVLEFKRADSLIKGGASAELVKDVTGMANAIGGRIIYGIAETKLENGVRVASGLDPIADPKMTREWITQVVKAQSGPPFTAFTIDEIPVEGGRVLVVNVDAAMTAHQSTLDRKYYQRVDAVVDAMVDFQVRDVMGRRTKPSVVFDLGRQNQQVGGDIHVYRFAPRVLNNGNVTIEHGYLQLDVPAAAQPSTQPIALKNYWDTSGRVIDGEHFVRFGYRLPDLHPEQEVVLDNSQWLPMLMATVVKDSWRTMREAQTPVFWRVYMPNARPIDGQVAFNDWCIF